MNLKIRTAVKDNIKIHLGLRGWQTDKNKERDEYEDKDSGEG